jgi:hypothetical protein
MLINNILHIVAYFISSLPKMAHLLNGTPSPIPRSDSPQSFSIDIENDYVHHQYYNKKRAAVISLIFFNLFYIVELCLTHKFGEYQPCEYMITINEWNIINGICGLILIVTLIMLYVFNINQNNVCFIRLYNKKHTLSCCNYGKMLYIINYVIFILSILFYFSWLIVGCIIYKPCFIIELQNITLVSIISGFFLWIMYVIMFIIRND